MAANVRELNQTMKLRFLTRKHGGGEGRGDPKNWARIGFQSKNVRSLTLPYGADKELGWPPKDYKVVLAVVGQNEMHIYPADRFPDQTPFAWRRQEGKGARNPYNKVMFYGMIENRSPDKNLICRHCDYKDHPDGYRYVVVTWPKEVVNVE